MRKLLALVGIAVGVMFFSGAAALAEGGGKGAAALGGVSILNEDSQWRLFEVLKPPVVENGGKTEKVAYQQHWLNTESAAPAEGWNQAEFDDSTWSLRPGRTSCETPYLGAFYLRGKFGVTDPSAVKGLALALSCNGGAVVYLNGKEVARDHVESGAKGALDYSAKAGSDLSKLALPAAGLKRGVNVVAIAIVRAPYKDGKPEPGKRETLYTLPSDACMMTRLQLASPAASGLVPSVSRPAGFQVWNGDVMVSDYTVDWGNPCEKLRPVEITGAKNGAFSGKLLVGSSKAIGGLKAVASDLKGAGGSIPASAVQIRYGMLWGAEHGSAGRKGGSLFGAMTENPPREVAVVDGGAVIPIWITVKTAKNTAAGMYTGEVKIAANGEAAVTVPVKMKVGEFVLPDPQNFRTVIELIQSPDTLALEYKEPLWSDKHFAMIGQSFKLMEGSGSRFVHIPAIAHTNLGNAESMIRWIKTGENQYDFDYSVMDKYLDVAAKNLGTPKQIVLQVWDLYMSTKESVGKRFSPELDARREASEGGRPQITLLDKKTGKTENGVAPDLMDPASRAIWKKLITGVKEHLQKRGLEKTLAFGMFTDAQPPKEHVQFFYNIAPEVKWVQEGHGRMVNKLYNLVDLAYQASVWNCQFADGMIQQYGSDKPIPVTSLHGWKLGRLDLIFERNVDLDMYPLTRWHFYPETAVSGETRGLGRMGADYWKSLKDKQGRRKGWAADRFPEGSWSGGGIQLNLCSSVLAPGPDGPVATTRLLTFCEGIQESEARIVIEEGLTDKKAKLGADLAAKSLKEMDERLDVMWKTLSDLQLTGSKWGDARLWRWCPGIAGNAWAASQDWQGRNEKLWELAGEVQKK